LDASLRRGRTAFLALLALTAVGTGAAVGGRAAGAADSAPRVGPATAVGRYRTVVSPRELNPLIVVTDTQTGRIWVSNPSTGKWEDKGVPPGAAAERD